MHAMVVGNSDGIGRALTERLLSDGWTVTGLSRSPAPFPDQHVVDVTSPSFPEVVGATREPDLLVYAAGVGDPLTDDLSAQTRALEVNLLGAARALEVVLPRMLAAGRGHVIGLSSMSDALITPQAPGYAASKAGLTAYLLALDGALRPRGVPVTTVRFGFVDTKMAKSPVTPFKITPARATDVLMRCIRTRPPLVSYPRRMAALTGVAAPLTRAAARLGRTRSG